MDQEKKNKFEELYRLIDITAKARYQAAKRLALHGYMTQWVLSFLAIGLIILSLLELLDFKLSFTATYTGFMQVVFAVIILTYSLLLGMGNFDARAERLHRCGLELSRLLRKVKPLKENEKPNMGSLSQKDENGYEQLVKDYYDCLEKYENHKDLDFRNALLKIQKRKGYPERNAEQPESGESKEIQKEKLG